MTIKLTHSTTNEKPHHTSLCTFLPAMSFTDLAHRQLLQHKDELNCPHEEAFAELVTRLYLPPEDELLHPHVDAALKNYTRLFDEQKRKRLEERARLEERERQLERQRQRHVELEQKRVRERLEERARRQLDQRQKRVREDLSIQQQEQQKEPHVKHCCSKCATTCTPMWRAGPLGKGTLCNACGVRWKTGGHKKI